MVTFLDSLINQLDAIGIKYYYDDDFGDDTAILLIHSEKKVGKNLSTSFVFKASSGDLIDVEFLENTTFDGAFKAERKEASS